MAEEGATATTKLVVGDATASNKSSTPPKKRLSVDMESHTGLRGISCLWVMLYHCFMDTPKTFSLQGPSLMPLFFSLSGFSLAVGE